MLIWLVGVDRTYEHGVHLVTFNLRTILRVVYCVRFKVILVLVFLSVMVNE